jgi:hypothetical protein
MLLQCQTKSFIVLVVGIINNCSEQDLNVEESIWFIVSAMYYLRTSSEKLFSRKAFKVSNQLHLCNSPFYLELGK